MVATNLLEQKVKLEHNRLMTMSEKASARLHRIKAFQESVRLREDDPATRPILERMKAIHDSNPEARKLAKIANTRASLLASCTLMNGPDLFVDHYLRSFVSEYNSRLFKGQGDKQPASFNVMSAFIEPDPEALVLKLLPEIHFSAKIETLMDSLTNPENDKPLSVLMDTLEELTIYQYHVVGGYSEISLGDLDLTFHGVAFVRNSDEVSIIGVFGYKVDKLSKARIEKRPTLFPGKEFLNSDAPLDLSDLEIIENSNRIPLITLSRISLPDSKSQVRYVLTETKDTFRVLTNDPQIHEDVRSSKDSEDSVRSILEELNKFIPAIDFVEQLPLFHAEIDDFEDFIKVVRHPTILRMNSSKSISKKIKKNLKPSECPNYVDVKIIDTPAHGSEQFELRPQNLKIEERGFWKVLPNFASGLDRNGNEVVGKSWVSAKESWYEITNVNYLSDQNISVQIRKTSAPGTVYIMRNAQHPKHTYKVGYTTKTSEQRADQLSSTSGQPDSFGVMHEWHVDDPRSVEQEVHRRLAAYRVSDRREFFQLEYKFVHECVQNVIDAMSIADDAKPHD